MVDRVLVVLRRNADNEGILSLVRPLFAGRKTRFDFAKTSPRSDVAPALVHAASGEAAPTVAPARAMTVTEFAGALGRPVSEVLRTLLGKGFRVDVETRLDRDQMDLVRRSLAKPPALRRRWALPTARTRQVAAVLALARAAGAEMLAVSNRSSLRHDLPRAARLPVLVHADEPPPRPEPPFERVRVLPASAAPGPPPLASAFARAFGVPLRVGLPGEEDGREMLVLPAKEAGAIPGGTIPVVLLLR